MAAPAAAKAQQPARPPAAAVGRPQQPDHPPPAAAKAQPPAAAPAVPQGAPWYQLYPDIPYQREFANRAPRFCPYHDWTRGYWDVETCINCRHITYEYQLWGRNQYENVVAEDWRRQ